MIRKKQKNRKIVIDLTGPQGNAFCLLGMANDFAKQLGWTKEEREKLQKDMMSSDYENLIKIFDNHFGDFVTLER